MWDIALTVLGGLALGLTLLPLLPFDAWWIRVWDFPRVQIAAAALLIATALVLHGGTESVPRVAFALALLLAALYQTVRIFPYTPIARRQVQNSRARTPKRSVSLLVANVLMTNRNSAALLRLIHEADPDLVLTVETDRWWEEQLRELESEYPHTVKEPLGNTYGMLLYSRLELPDAEVRYLVEDDIPSIHTWVQLRSGDRVRLHCLHPKPPAPQESDRTTERDAELLIVGKTVAEMDVSTIVAGDMNDVAWSDTTQLFQKNSGLLDPRIGRGMFNTFSAKIPLLRWPLDHIFHSNDFELIRMKRLPAFGSDHFPVFASLALRAEASLEQPEPEPDRGERERADEKIGQVQQKESAA